MNLLLELAAELADAAGELAGRRPDDHQPYAADRGELVSFEAVERTGVRRLTRC